MPFDLDGLLRLAIEQRASDLHLKVGAPPLLRVDHQLIPVQDRPYLTQADLDATVGLVTTELQRQQFVQHRELDVSYGVAGLGRFRTNLFQQRGTVGATFRVIPLTVDTIEELNLPSIIGKLAMEPRGMVLVTGTAGSGKSTTLAAMIGHINNNRTGHIVTIEDPIEFLHADNRCLINQREVGIDTESFAGALRSALRQDPDVILVGEMRDFDTISTAIVAAETGHLVLSTLHTIDAAETVNRIIAIFPPYQQKQIRLQLAALLRGVISMRLIPRIDGVGRVPAVEVMVATATIRECIADTDKTRKIPEVIAAGTSEYGMQTFDQSLMSLFQRGLVSYEEALRWSSNPNDFALKVRGIESAADQSWTPERKGQPRERKLH
ncbi:MAG: type IV pilus twitching motility protein PilT [Candidatus Methylomirabilis oxygeniifera]|uniref:Twitching mobility protein n=1 Tax=Methylomirabilis oxygeniifera TaxID=671143 RepID=D5MF58_METO1|nr:MAG: type IV pilus twitching motility protein PilT [Candidatus Methylomirabilis oxyfera]CBE68387.1 Twitching mobility protein [Candidatus Methylomirabilis oxyfera]